MISTDLSAQVTVSSSNNTQRTLNFGKPGRKHMHFISWICLVLACVGASWFACQYFLVPQPQYFAPDWHDAQWIGASDGNAGTAYFRFATNMPTVPDNAFVTIAASQVFRLYVNGTFIGSSSGDFGNYPRAYMYDITPSLLPGPNVFAIRVDNLDGQSPLLRTIITNITGSNVSYYGTGAGWQATTQNSLAYPQNTPVLRALTAWTALSFESASSWPPAMDVAQSPVSPSLIVNSSLYELPVATQWINGGTGYDAYFVRQVSLPDRATASWLRVVSTGTTTVFINGTLMISWNYQSAHIRQVVIDKATGNTSVKYENELVVGTYDVSPYLHTGVNTIAVHVSLQNTSGVSVSSVPADPELSLDIIFSDNQGHMNWLHSPAGWKVSTAALSGWTSGSTMTPAWATPVVTGRPNEYHLVYLSASNVLSGELPSSQIIPSILILEVILWSIIIVSGSWLFMSLVIMRRYFYTRREALEIMSLAYLPALALEGVLIVLSGEPLIPRPFPYTGLWALVLVALVGAGFCLIWLYARSGIRGMSHIRSAFPHRHSSPFHIRQDRRGTPGIISRSLIWFRFHWAIIPLILVAIPLAFYNLGYEAYWQDELASFFVAQSITRTGLPLLPSGFVYPKAELYSYMLALVMQVFGNQAGTLRMVSAVEYILTLLLLYRVGCYFFDRRVALLATVMLAFSPHTLIWAQQVRMYQQAQLLTLLTLYLFYKAVHERCRVYLIYLAAGSLIATYLSHEETFIILPALLVSVLLVSFMMRDKHHRLSSVLYQKHWWFAAAIVVSAIGAQQLIVHLTHPPLLGTDVSLQPEVQFTTDSIRYYFNLLFAPTAHEPANNPLVASIPRTIVLNTVLAALGCFWVRKSNNPREVYIAIFFVIGLLTLTFMLTIQEDRYFYTLFTLYYLLASFALMKMMRAVWTFACARNLRSNENNSTTSHRSTPIKLLVALTTVLAFLSVVIMPVLPFSSYNLFTSRLLGLTYYHHFGDYTGTEQYLGQHIQKGDIVISIIPDPIVLYYAGRSNYFFSINHALFLFERDGHIVDTYTGNIALLDQTDFDAVLASHDRIWLISADNYYQREVLDRFIIPPDFHVVYVGSNSIVYLRGS